MAVNYNYRNHNKDKLILWFYLNFVCQRSSHGTGNIELRLCFTFFCKTHPRTIHSNTSKYRIVVCTLYSVIGCTCTSCYQEIPGICLK